jgi:hypothetical protein
MWATIGIATVAILAFGAGCCTRKWIAEHEDARPIKLGAVMAKNQNITSHSSLAAHLKALLSTPSKRRKNGQAIRSAKFLLLKIQKKCRWNSVANYLR